MCLSSFIHSLVLSPRGRSGRSQSPVMEPIWLLAHCILGKFLGVVCHCFPPPSDFPTFVAKCLYVRSDAGDPNSERWNCGREFCLNSDFHVNLGIFYDMGPTALLPFRRKACWGYFRPKNPTASAGFEPANWGTKGQHRSRCSWLISSKYDASELGNELSTFRRKEWRYSHASKCAYPSLWDY